jgi:hypothetical protein
VRDYLQRVRSEAISPLQAPLTNQRVNIEGENLAVKGTVENAQQLSLVRWKHVRIRFDIFRVDFRG